MRLNERRRDFNVRELITLAATAVERRADDVTKIEKLAEGGFNRSFLLTMHDGFRLVARIPYHTTEPQSLAVSSEVATLDYLRSHDMPVPEVYGYPDNGSNPAGTPYTFLEMMSGTNLGDIWFELGEKARIEVVRGLVELESRLFAPSFPASGSLYYSRDLGQEKLRCELPSAQVTARGPFCIGPDTTLAMWFGKRSEIGTSREPRKMSRSVRVF